MKSAQQSCGRTPSLKCVSTQIFWVLGSNILKPGYVDPIGASADIADVLEALIDAHSTRTIDMEMSESC